MRSAPNSFRPHGPSLPSCTPHGSGLSRSPASPGPAASFFGAIAALLLLVLALSAVSALGGLERPLSQAEIVAQSRYCRSYGLKPVFYTNGRDASIRSVQCEQP